MKRLLICCEKGHRASQNFSPGGPEAPEHAVREAAEHLARVLETSYRCNICESAVKVTVQEPDGN